MSSENQHPIGLILGNEALNLCDVGASYFLPDTWHLLSSSSKSTFVLVEPNGQNLEYASRYPNATFIQVPLGLSKNGGLETLYLANTDSGSSILPPVGDPEKADAEKSFFPLTLIDVETSTLKRVLDDHKIEKIDAVKLDTQGSELDILNGLDSSRFSNLLFVEMEVGLRSPHHHEGAATVASVQQQLESQGFMFANMRFSRHETSTDSGLAIPNECDLLFARPAAFFEKAEHYASTRKRAIAIAVAYYLHDYAKALIHCTPENPAQLDQEFNETALFVVERIAEAQSTYLKGGGLSLWHRDR